MNNEALRRFVDAMIQSAIKAGQFALESQGKVQNIGKEDEEELMHTDSEFAKDRNRAKTIIDEQVQEMLLATALATLGGEFVRLDAEEDTPSKKKFTSQDADTTLVIDPIDGTLEYLNGKDNYSVCVALVSKGAVLAALVYFPVHKILYLLDVDHKSYQCACDDMMIANKELMQSPEVVQNSTVYVNNRVSQETNTCLSEKFTVVKDVDGQVIWPEALFKCMAGEYKAALFIKPQIRDVLLGAMIERMPSGYAVDFSGDQITWPDGGRIPEVIFGFGALPDAIKKCLRNSG